jgi:hypothetical protein
MTQIYDNNKLLSQKELEFIQQQAENLTFDWAKEGNLEVYISEEEDNNGLNIQVLVENDYGYFGWNTNHDLIKHDMEF